MNIGAQQAIVFIVIEENTGAALGAAICERVQLIARDGENPAPTTKPQAAKIVFQDAVDLAFGQAGLGLKRN